MPPAIDKLLAAHERKDLLRMLTAGSVDDGKSTLIGRLLVDSKGLYDDHLKALEKDSKRVGSAAEGVDYALVTDGLRAEREQGITIDVAYRYFSTPKRKFIIADCPGHEQYTRNMATGASTCDLAVILIDARQGVLPQTRRHSFIASLLGIDHILVCINKMDQVGYDQKVFESIRADYVDFAARLEAKDFHYVPISALEGDNVVERSTRMDWYKGAPLLHLLETVHIASDRNFVDLRLPVQHVLRQSADFRGYQGTLASGMIRPGDEVQILPSGQKTKIDKLFVADKEAEEAFPPQAVTVSLKDELDVSRGDLIVRPGNRPRVEDRFFANLVWMAEEPLRKNKSYVLKLATTNLKAEVSRVEYAFDMADLKRRKTQKLELNDIGLVELSLAQSLAFDAYSRNKNTGAFVLIDTVSNATVAAGMILERRVNDQAKDAKRPVKGLRRHESTITAAERAKRLGQSAHTIWLTGLPCAGKTTIAFGLERRLFDAGYVAQVLDGENLRQGLSENLGFGALDRGENVRRVAQVARMMNEAGLLSIVALVSPFAEDRAAARRIIGPERFFEVHLAAPLDCCEARDKAGLYARARSGIIDGLAGIQTPYEIPKDPNLVLPTHEISVDESIERLFEQLMKRAKFSES